MLGITEECSGSRRNAGEAFACTHALVEGTLQGPSARRANLAAM